MELKVIAYARNGHTDKFGIPRQSREESPIVTRIVFEPEYAVVEALRGIDDEETVCRAAVIELLELVANALRRFDVLKHRAKPDHRLA